MGLNLLAEEGKGSEGTAVLCMAPGLWRQDYMAQGGSLVTGPKLL